MARHAQDDDTPYEVLEEKPRVRAKRKHKMPKQHHTVLVARKPLPTGKEALRRLSLSIAIALVLAIPLIVVFRLAHGQRPDIDQLVPDRTVATSASGESTVRIMMVGDVLVHQGVWESGMAEDGTANYDHLFANIAEDLAESDLALLDQETVLGGTQFEGGLTGSPRFNSPQEIGDAEVKAGFDVILKANDHAMDKGNEGLTSELMFWRNSHSDTRVVGAVMPGETTAAEAANPAYVTVGDVTVAILNYTQSLGGYYDPSDAVAEMSEYQMQSDIENARNNADIVVVCPHWGTDGQTTPDDTQRYYADLMNGWGVDIVFGCGPHVLQPVEIMKRDDGHEMLVFWSVGAFVSTLYEPSELVGGIAKATITRSADGVRVTDYGLIPTVTHRGYGAEMTTYRLSKYTKALAETNFWEFDNTEVTKSWVTTWCKDVLGNRFDTSTLELHGSMHQDTVPDAGETVQEEPVEGQPVEEQPVEEQPVEEQPVEGQPVE